LELPYDVQKPDDRTNRALTVDPTPFTPIASTVGGAIIGLAAVLLMASHGRIAGISTIASRLLPAHADQQTAGRLLFVLGLMAAPLIYATTTGKAAAMTVTSNPLLLASAGLLVGFGAVLGNGCTSGHGICGLYRFSKRSIIAVAVFMATALAPS
jgi:uncharacterized protein